MNKECIGLFYENVHKKNKIAIWLRILRNKKCYLHDDHVNINT